MSINCENTSLRSRWWILFLTTLTIGAVVAVTEGQTSQGSQGGDSRERVINALRGGRHFTSYRMRQDWSTADRHASFLLEFVAPDRTHMVKDTYEEIYIGKTAYGRKANEPWERTPIAIAIGVPKSDINETIKQLGEVRFIGRDTIGDISVLGYQYSLTNPSDKPASPNEIWIGVKDGLIYRTKYETLCPSKDWGRDTTTAEMVTVNVVTTYSGYDSEIVIDAPEKAAQEAAESWLSLVDSGRYAESWTEAASLLKKSYSQETWEKRLGEFARRILNPMRYRDLRTIQSVQSLPGNRNVQGVVLTYAVTLERPANGVPGMSFPIMQTLELVLDTDETWRVANYRPDVMGEPGGYGPGTGGGMAPGSGRGVGPGNGYNTGGGDPRMGGGLGPGTSVDTKPVPLNNPKPQYTEEARKNKIQGNVSARVLVGADGLVKQVKITRGLPDGLDEQAIQTAYQMRFKPAMKGGNAVAYWMPVLIEFNLR